MKIHVALVSEQTLANLIPALMERPDLVVLVCTSAMAARELDQRLRRLLEAANIRVEIQGDAPEVGLRQIQAFARGLLQRLGAAYPGADLVLNATGGTKLMSLGFVEVVRSHARRVLYTDTVHRRIECLPVGQDEPPDPIAMSDVLDVPGYLAAQGFAYAAARSDDADWRHGAMRRHDLSLYLGERAPELQGFFGGMNYLLKGAIERIPGSREDRLDTPSQRLSSPPWGVWAEALGRMAAAGLIDWRRGGQNIRFLDLASAQYLHGGWLEEYAWHRLRHVRPHDTRMGVTGHWEGAPKSENEFDVLACHLNQLLFVECKTARIDGENDNQIAYKLDKLGRDARGLFGATWLLSAREPSLLLRERARQARIQIIEPNDLPRLAEAAAAWMQGPR